MKHQLILKDKAIKMAFNGYLHHIADYYKQYIKFGIVLIQKNVTNGHESFIDSYDWVMIQNVYSMGQWSDGGMSMRKPYISSDIED